MKTSIKLSLLLFITSIFSIQCAREAGALGEPEALFYISSSYVDFGKVKYRGTATKKLSITNKGAGELRITGFRITNNSENAFSVSAKPVTLGANETYDLQVTFAPKSGGNKSAILKITANDIDNNVNLVGNAAQDPQLVIQEAWVYFKNKPNAAEYFANPTKMLSNRALKRREKQNIKLDTLDVPIYETYVQQIRTPQKVGVLAQSKWMNAIFVVGRMKDIQELGKKHKFIKNIEFADKSLNSENKSTIVNNTFSRRNKFEVLYDDFDYGKAKIQNEMLNIEYLHKKGFTGKGIIMAIIDAGFPGVNTLSGFARLRDNNGILGGYNFVDRSNNFYKGSSHGTNVLSNIAGFLDSNIKYVGTAPDASFYLFITEIENAEIPKEEILWAEAAERADSLGVDVINTSLGYSIFDNHRYDYTYSDMDGKTAFITRAANIAASRGIVLVNAAGNEGSNEWRYISAPADSKLVLTVGAVDRSKQVAEFSSRGPTSDGRIKPDVMAMGKQVFVLDDVTGLPRISNGTSFASPIMSGAVACLWQALPNETAVELVEDIKKYSSNHSSPNNDYGHGIPNFETIYVKLKDKP